MKISPLANNIQANNNVLNNNTLNNKAVNQTSPSFKGSKDGLFTRAADKLGLVELIAQGTAKLSQTKFSENLVNFSRKFASPSARWADAESVAITFFYMYNTWKSDKIDEERKVPSMIQNAAVTIVSSLAAAAIDAACKPLIDKLTLAYQDLPKETIAKLGNKSAKQFYDAAGRLKSNTIFTAVVRFIIPVMMVPIVGKIVSMVKENAEKNKADEENKQKITQPAPMTANLFKASDDDHENDIHDDDDDDHDDDDDKKKIIQMPVKIQPEAQMQKLNTTQGYAPIISFEQTENKFKSLYA